MSVGLPRGQVELVPYSDFWKLSFEKEAELLHQVLHISSENIHHVGSTAVPGLLAKPIIDIMINFPDLPTQSFLKPIKEYNYHFRQNASTPKRMFYAKGSESLRTHYLHIVKDNSSDMRNLISFRDILRANRDLLYEYGELKKVLEIKFKNNRKKYTDGKALFIQKVISENK